MRINRPASKIFVILFLFMAFSPASAQLTIGTFTGGDAGEGLDLDGVFQYAVNVRGPAAGAVRDAIFTDETAAGVTITAVNEILSWTDPDYGSTSNDDNLEVVVQSIRWSAFPTDVNVDLANLLPGRKYRLQLLFAEQCCTRGFDIYVEGALIVAEFAPFATQAGTNTTAQGDGAVVSFDFVAGDDTLNIILGGTDTIFNDDNPILNGFTLEVLGPQAQAAPIPTLSWWATILMALILAGAGYAVMRRAGNPAGVA